MSSEPTQFNEDSLEVVQPGALEAIARADINQQIATAKQFPRSLDLKKMQGRMIQMAAYSPEAAAECFYCIPRAGLDIYGPSVRLSEIVAYVWGNLYSVSRILDINPVSRLVTAQAVAWDLEANVKEGIEYTQRITIKGPDGQKTAALSAIAMAGRNAKLKLVPRVVWWPVYERCLAVARGDVVPLGDRIAKMIKSFAVYGITLDRILAKFSYENVTQFQENDLPALIGYYTAIKEEASTPEEIFPRPSQGEQKPVVEGAEKAQHPSGSGAEPSGESLRQDTGHEPISEGVHEQPTPRRPRGRPRGTGRKPESNISSAPPPVVPAFTPDAPQGYMQYGPAADLPGITQFPTQEETKPEQPQAGEEEQEDPKKLAAKLRALLEQSKKSEGALMAKLREWGFGKNLPSEPIRLEDYGENTLTQVIERWFNLSTHVR